MNSVGVHSTKMKLDCALNSSEGDVDCLSGGDASREVGNRSPPIAFRIFDDSHEVANCLHGLVLFIAADSFWIAMSFIGSDSRRSVRGSSGQPNGLGAQLQGRVRNPACGPFDSRRPRADGRADGRAKQFAPSAALSVASPC